MPIEYREQHRREAIIGTVLIHALLAGAFLLTVFRGPDPPLLGMGEEGVELNYGLDPAGYGDVQTTATANESQNREDSRPPAASPDPQPEQASEPVRTEASEEKIITSEAEESPVSVPPVEKPSPPKEEVRETPRPVEKPRTLYTPKGSDNGGGNGTAGTSNTPTGNNNGDRPGSVGDQGDPNGSLDAKALYGKPGHGNGGSGSSSLSMPGWAFETRPNPKDVSNESGELVFKIKISEDGEVENVIKVSGNVSPAVEKIYRDEVYNKATFRRVSEGSGGATGFIRFVIRAD
ncbi:hypothetical protein LJY25_00340 [Hymenobacter sp. BT175]|uniref:hypothetical protein n=1 Tax=Hymenobacter translucens TaxID=2886507 RepID=UPI001D0F0DE7|nr:hypothetical protein [Hymenobacter translucens]MCC2544877.1 hypothetical protein [Hymenobacter translucens]